MMSLFGQPPLAALLPLKAGQNLADLPDKTIARSNLGTLSASEIMMNSVPLGTIISFWGTTAPTGYLPCNGQTVNSGTFPDLVTFLGGTTSATLPDLRGEFLRGWDNGRGVDVGRSALSLQIDAFQGHDHSSGWFTSATSGSTQRPDYSPGTAATVLSGKIVEQSSANYTPRYEQRTGPILQDSANGAPRTSTETRPRNVAVQYCMKAYGALVNTSTANMGNVLTELSQTAKITQFESSLGVSGYQKLPNGLIFQWGLTGILTNNTTTVITLPISFPNACLNASATCQYTGIVNGANVLAIASVSTSSISITPDDVGTTTSPNLKSYWFALGY